MTEDDTDGGLGQPQAASGYTDQPIGRPERPQRLTRIQRNRVQSQIEEEALSFTEAFSAGRSLDAVAPAIADHLESDSPEADPGFEFTDDVWKELTEGIPPEDQDIFEDVESMEEGRNVRSRYLKEREVEEQIAQAGWTGLSARLLAGVLDETALGAILVTEGAATPWILSAKATRMTRTLRAAGAAAGTEGAIQSYINTQRETKGADDVVFAALMGAAIGAPFGAIARPIGSPGTAEGTIPGQVTGFANDSERFTRAAQHWNEEQMKDAIQIATRLERTEVDRAVDNLKANQRALREVQEELEGTRAAQERLRTETPQERVLREEGVDVQPQPLRSREELESAVMRRQQVSREDDLDEAVIRALTPQRAHGRPPGRKEAFKIRERAQRRVQQAARDQAFEAEEMPARVRDLEGRADYLERLIRDQQTELDAPARSRLGMGVGEEVLTGRAQEQRPSVFDATPEANVRAPSPETGTGGDAGAAQVAGVRMDPTDSPIDEDAVPEAVSHRAHVPYNKVRIDMAGRLMSSESYTMNFLARTLLSDPLAGDSGRRFVGQADQQVRMHSAAETQDRLFTAGAVNFLKNALPAWKNFAREQRMNFWQRNFPGPARVQFFERVTRAIRTGGDEDEHVMRAARAIQDGNKAILERARQAGLAGFDEVQENMRYIHRQWEPNKFRELNNDPEVGGAGIRDLLTEAIIRGNPDTPHQIAQSMAKAVHRRFNAKGHGVQANFNRAFFGRDIDETRRILREAELDESEVQNVVRHLQAADRQSGADDAGQISFARNRINMDEDAAIDLPSGRRLHFSDLTENNAERLHINYLRNITGHIAVAQRLKPHLDAQDVAERGIRTDAEFQRLKNVAASEGASVKELNDLTMGYNLITGRPPEDNVNSTFHQVLRFIRDWNFTRLMGQVGFAQIAEWGPVMSQVGTMTLLRNIPKFRDLVHRGKNGELNDPILREMEEFELVFGAERMVMQPGYRMEAHGMEGNSGVKALNSASNFVEVLKRGVGDVSGMSGITLYMQRMAGLSAAQKMLKLSKAGQLDNARMRSLGLDEDMIPRVQRELAEKSSKKQMESGRYADVLNLEQWEPEVREAFLDSMHRWGSRMVQRNLPGELPAFMHTTVGQLLGQFRSFMMNAYQKQLLQGVNMKDFQTFTSFAFSMMFAGAAYTAQQSLNSIGRSDAQEFREERLSPAEIGLSSFQRAGFASLIPGAVDTIAPLTPMLDEGIFRYGRSSGLATDFITGNPTIDFLDSLHGSIRGLASAPMRDDYDFSQNDFRNLWTALALNNVTGIRNVGNVLMEDLPRESVRNPQSIEDLLGIESIR